MLINEIKICFSEDSEITEDLIDKIIKVKHNYWQYTHQQHKRWIQENINENEYHLVLIDSNNQVIAYLNIIKTIIKYDGIIEDVMGIGNVCVSTEFSKQGIGQLLMNICNYYLDNFGKQSILLCKESLVNFYQKSGWMIYNGEIYLNGILLESKLMTKKSLEVSSISLERNF